MRKIIEQAVVTLDGQVSTPQDWLLTRWAGQFEQLSKDLLFSVDSLLYGRVSYENHAEVWPTMEERFGDYAVRMNTIPKHVASRTLTEAKWNATLLGDPVVEAVRTLKEQPGSDILKIGTGGSFSRCSSTDWSTNTCSGCSRSSPAAANGSTTGSTPRIST